MQALGQVGQAHDLAAKAAGQLFAALQRAVGNGDGLGVLGAEVSGAELNHLAGTHEQNFHLAQVFKQLPGQTHGGGGHADGVGANFG